jgi:hypothetical protein
VIRPVDPSSWRVASTTAFNGSQENHFDSTSLHLSFTDYYVPVHLTGQQNQDSQVFYLESYVSVYDCGKWVGDIDVLKAFSSARVSRARSRCRHAPGTELELDNSPRMISAESWHDILDPPVERFVVRAHGNWVARLAASVMLLQVLPEDDVQGVVICPPRCCWHCITRIASSTRRKTGTRLGDFQQMAPGRACIY